MIKSLRRTLALCALLSPLFYPSAHAAAPQEVTYLLAAPPNLPAYGPWMIAQQKGYYADEGLKVNFVTARGGVDVAKQVGAGNAMIGSAIGDTAIIVRANGVPIRTVALMGSGSLTLLAARADANIKTIGDLRGKTISVMAYGDTTYYALLGLLGTAGLGKSDVHIEASGPSGVWQNFATGKAQAMGGVPDWIVSAREAGVKVDILPTHENFYSMAQAIIASDDAIRNHPDIVQKMVRATLRGQRDIIDDPHAAAAVYAKAIPAFAGKEGSVEAAFKLYKQYVYGQQPVLGASDAKRYEQVQEFYVKQGIVAHATPVAELFTNQFVGSSVP